MNEVQSPSPTRINSSSDETTSTAYRVQSVERSLDILLALAEGPASLTRVAERTGLSKPTAFRLLASLGYRHVVVKDSTANLYFLGPGAMVLGRGVGHTGGWISDLVKGVLSRLLDGSKETVTLHVSAGTDRICIEELPSPLPIRYTASVGSAAPLAIGSAGKILLAFMRPEVAERLIATAESARYADGRVVDRDELRRQVEATRKRGWATTSGERVPGASSISVPIRGAHGSLAALSVLGPTERFPRRRFEILLGQLRAAAEEIERETANSFGTARSESA
jgi:DNA-binding IclR family transcriptional regulator